MLTVHHILNGNGRFCRVISLPILQSCLESLKTEAHKVEEATLLEKHVCLVEERNRLEEQIDENEQM